MQAEAVPDGEPEGRRGRFACAEIRDGAGATRPLLRPGAKSRACRPRKVGGLRHQSAARLFFHLGERLAEARGDRRRHGSLDERRLAEQDAGTLLRREELEGHLGREDGAAEVHQDQHAVLRPRRLDGVRDAHGVGAQRVSRLIEAAGRGQPQVLAAHLGGQLGGALGQPGAVTDEDDADHGAARPGPESPGVGSSTPASTSAAACSSSQDDVAPGSWWPALRSPR